jgi:hypothetical protein
MLLADNCGPPILTSSPPNVSACYLGKDHTDKTSFHPQGGLGCAHNVTVLVKSIANATQLLPSVLSLSCPHGPTCEVDVFDFVPKLLHILHNPSLMNPEILCWTFKIL